VVAKAKERGQAMEARGTANGKATEVGAKEKARAKVQETAGEARETLETSTRVTEGKARSEFQRSARGRGAVVHQRGVTTSRLSFRDLDSALTPVLGPSGLPFPQYFSVSNRN